MTNKEKQLLIKLLNIAGEEFSNHGCNDCPEKWFENWTEKERFELDERLNNAIIGDKDYMITGIFGNHMLFQYFSVILEKEVNEKDEKT